MFQRILIPIDFSPGSERALVTARSAFPGAQLKLLHVLDARAVAVPDLTTGGVTPVVPGRDLQHELGQGERDRLQAVAREGEEFEMVAGDPVRGILQMAREWNADLILMGTHGRRGLQHFFLGSVAETVVREAHVPVMTVRDERE